MNTRFVVAVLLASASPAAHSLEPSFRFSGEVVVDHQMPLAYGMEVGARREEFIDLPAGLKLEVASANVDGVDAETQTRLLKPLGNGRFVVLHQARTVGPSSLDRSITDRVCGDQVTFMTPAPRVSPTCVAAPSGRPDVPADVSAAVKPVRQPSADRP